MKKHIVLVGGAGVIGSILTTALQSRYRITVIDRKKPEQLVTYVEGDATNYKEITTKLPKDTDVIVNLLKIDTSDEIEHMDEMVDVYFKASYNLLHAAVERNIPKVIFASSNHVTDVYEEEGKSLLGREINIHDYPYSKGLYGILKLASENAGYMMSAKTGLSVINIRIGSVPKNEEQALQEDHRLRHTLLTREDTVGIFAAAIEADISFGTYYGVSDNPDKPWDMSQAHNELGFESLKNSFHIITE